MTPIQDWQWWQYIVAILGVIGLSPAPWIVAVLTGRLMPLGAHLQRIADLKESHKSLVDTLTAQRVESERTLREELERVSGEREYERTARATERDPSDAATSKLSDFAGEFGKSTVGLLAGLRQQQQRTGPIPLIPAGGPDGG
jgi:hypothetical protein